MNDATNTPVLRLPIFDETMHAYTFEGKPVPAVSSILRARSQPWLAPWKVKMALEGVRSRFMDMSLEGRKLMVWEPQWIETILVDAKKDADRKSKEAADIGHEVHAWIKAFIADKGRPNETILPTDPAALSSVKAFLAWVEKEQPEWLLSEQIVFHEQEWYAGTLDAVARIKGGALMLVDVKTSARVSDDHLLQTAAYVMAGDACGVLKHDASRYLRLILRVPKDGKEFEAHYVNSNLEHDYAAFLACRTLTRWNQEREENRK